MYIYTFYIILKICIQLVRVMVVVMVMLVQLVVVVLLVLMAAVVIFVYSSNQLAPSQADSVGHVVRYIQQICLIQCLLHYAW